MTTDAIYEYHGYNGYTVLEHRELDYHLLLSILTCGIVQNIECELDLTIQYHNERTV